MNRIVKVAVLAAVCASAAACSTVGSSVGRLWPFGAKDELWVASTRGNSVQRLNLRTGKAELTVPVGVAPFMVPLPVTYLGKLDTNVDAFVQRCQRIIFDGPLDVEMARAGGDGL